MLLNPMQTSEVLPWSDLVKEIAALLIEDGVNVPPRVIQALPGGGSLFVMPAFDSRLTVAKLITFTPANYGTARPAIQGDVVVFDTATGERKFMLDGPTVTARRTAAVTVLAAQMLAPNQNGPLLIIGAGVQGLAHIEAFAAVMKIGEVVIASRSESSAQTLATHARALGLQARVASDANVALPECPMAVTCTPARTVALHRLPRLDGFIGAVGAFAPHMAELGTDLCRYFQQHGAICIDSPDAMHEAGDLLQAGIDATGLMTLAEVLRQGASPQRGPVLFKSCGWAGWDLAAARVAAMHL